MRLIKYNPFGKSVSNFFDDFLSQDISTFFGSDFSFNLPSVNVVENEDNFRIEVAAPGLEKDDFEINVDNGMLRISAAKEQSREEKEEGKFMRREFNYGTFSRSFQLPELVNADAIAAKYENGVLNINLPKKEEAKVQAAKTIEIK